MQGRLFTAAAALFLIACSPTPQVIAPTQSTPTSTSVALSRSEMLKIGNKIWQNESGRKVSGLTAWNAGEEFPSLGIGHFIWYPTGVRGPFTESWPQFIQFALNRGAAPPAIARLRSCPWRSRAEFQSKTNSPEVAELRRWLAANVPLQAEFISQKSRAALSKIIAAAPAKDRARIQNNYRKVATTSNGTYALIDYVNFKGEGINPKERYRGQGWGLLQVLTEMKNTSAGQPAAQEFARSAKFCLGRRIANSPKSRGEARWKAGWFNRCNTYAKPF